MPVAEDDASKLATARGLLTHLSRYHDPGFFTCCPHNPRAQAIWHDSAHQLAECTDTIKHIHLKKVADDDD